MSASGTPLRRLTPRNILKVATGGRLIKPEHPITTWDAPFFYEDSHHVFYVTTKEEPVKIFDDHGYGVAATPSFKQSAQIPPLLVQTGPRQEVGPKFGGDGGPVGLDPGVIDPARMQRFVTEDAYIRQGIGTTGSVIYGVSGLNQPIGPVRCLTLIQKALELCGEVRSLGGALLSALEKRDGEHLVLIRQRHEVQVQKMAQEVRFLQWKSAQEARSTPSPGAGCSLETIKSIWCNSSKL